MRYIGETERELKKRLINHKGYVQNQMMNQATGYHFNLQGHSLDNMKITIVEKVKKLDAAYRKERETFHMNQFNTRYKGLKRMP